ncbi:unnamed protein product [Leuciscus chuanchicus]
MSKRFSAAETLDILLESSGEEGGLPDCGLESSGDQGSETDSQTEFDQDCEDTDGEDSEEEDPGVLTYASKNGEIVWTAAGPTQTPGRAPAEHVMKMTPGPTRYACSRVDNIRSAFELFFPEETQKTLIDMTNLEGKRVYGESWKEVDWVDLQAYIGLLLLAGVYRSHNEATRSLWNADTGRGIFRATMSLGTFEVMTRVIRFDNRDTRLTAGETTNWLRYEISGTNGSKICLKFHKEATVSTGEERKPDVILDYNKTKGGVDSLDQMVAAYTCKRKSNRWPMVVFSNMLDVSALNAFVLWSEINPAWNAGKTFRRRIFLEELGKALVSPQIERRKSVPRGAASLRMLNQIRQPSSENIPGTSTATPSTKRKRKAVKDLGLEGRITGEKAGKKWENLKKRYKAIVAPEHEPLEEDISEPVSTLHPTTPVRPTTPTTTCPTTPATTRPPTTPATPSSSKRKRGNNLILDFLQAESVKEQERHKETEAQTERFLTLFEKLVDKMPQQ